MVLEGDELDKKVLESNLKYCNDNITRLSDSVRYWESEKKNILTELDILNAGGK